MLNKQLLLTQFAAALGCLGEGGHFVCKAFDLFTPFSAGLLYLLHTVFDRVCIYKPAQSRPANSERYLVCRAMRPSGTALENAIAGVSLRALHAKESDAAAAPVPCDPKLAFCKPCKRPREDDDAEAAA